MTEPHTDAPATAGEEPSAESRDSVGRWPASLADVRDVYDDQADTMARLSPLNRLLTGRYRRLFGRARGRVLDAACGTGLNARYLPESTEYVGVDLSPEMLEGARDRLDAMCREATLSEMDAQNLEFSDHSFETIIPLPSTCTFPDPDVALSEMNRVCKPDGSVLLVEHGRSSVGPVARFQDWWADAHYERHACRWTQDPVALVADSDLDPVEVETAFLGIITTVDARPG
jgi:ubiquinone/menaquinone biosynthesis C-methylase UbiE